MAKILLCLGLLLSVVLADRLGKHSHLEPTEAQIPTLDPERAAQIVHEMRLKSGGAAEAEDPVWICLRSIECLRRYRQPELRGTGRRHFEPELVTRPICDRGRDCDNSITVGYPRNTFTPEMRPRLYSEYMADYMGESEYMVFTPPLPEPEYQRILVDANLDGLEDRADEIPSNRDITYRPGSVRRDGFYGRFKQEHTQKAQSHAKSPAPKLVAPRLVSASELSAADAEARRRESLVSSDTTVGSSLTDMQPAEMLPEQLSAEVALAEVHGAAKAKKAKKVDADDQMEHGHEGEIEVRTATSDKTIFQSKPILQPAVASDDETPRGPHVVIDEPRHVAFARGRQVDAVLGVEDEY